VFAEKFIDREIFLLVVCFEWHYAKQIFDFRADMESAPTVDFMPLPVPVIAGVGRGGFYIRP